MDRWDMVFDEDPHGNTNMPLYFLKKIYVEFILGKHVNYFDILEFQGIGQECLKIKHNFRGEFSPMGEI